MTTLPPYTPPSPVREGRGVLFWIAAGCSGCLVLLVALVLILYLVVIGAMKRSTPVEESLARARSDQRVAAALGQPIDTGYLWMGKINLDNSDGEADINVPLKGPKGGARLHIVAGMSDGKWIYEEMVVQPEQGPKIDLLHPAP
jgi:hypothetical protein